MKITNTTNSSNNNKTELLEAFIQDLHANVELLHELYFRSESENVSDNEMLETLSEVDSNLLELQGCIRSFVNHEKMHITVK